MLYADAQEMLGSRSIRRLPGSATWLERLDAETIGVRLYSTVVVRIHADGSYTLNTGGYWTVTTKRRINDYSPARVCQRDFAWYVADGDWSQIVPFVDGMRVDAGGRVRREGARALALVR